MESNETITTAANGKVNIVDDDSFINEVLESDTPVLVDFMATWCGPCKVMGPIFNELAPEYQGRVKFAKVDVDQAPNVAGALQVSSIPTFMLFQGRTVYAAGVGSRPANSLRQWIDEGLQTIADNPNPTADETEPVQSEA